MPHGNTSQERTFGYLSTVETAEHGYFGGYLVISSLGRPLEFHCTAPIRPSRAQQILYGPTLQPYLLGEQICGALLEAAKLNPAVIVTDCEAALHAPLRTAVPMVMVMENVGEPHASDFALGAFRLRSALGYERDEHEILETLALLMKHVDLVEPFARIRDAIREAQRIGGTGAHDQAA